MPSVGEAAGSSEPGCPSPEPKMRSDSTTGAGGSSGALIGPRSGGVAVSGANLAGWSCGREEAVVAESWDAGSRVAELAGPASLGRWRQLLELVSGCPGSGPGPGSGARCAFRRCCAHLPLYMPVISRDVTPRRGGGGRPPGKKLSPEKPHTDARRPTSRSAEPLKK